MLQCKGLRASAAPAHALAAAWGSLPPQLLGAGPNVSLADGRLTHEQCVLGVEAAIALQEANMSEGAGRVLAAVASKGDRLAVDSCWPCACDGFFSHAVARAKGTSKWTITVDSRLAADFTQPARLKNAFDFAHLVDNATWAGPREPVKELGKLREEVLRTGSGAAQGGASTADPAAASAAFGASGGLGGSPSSMQSGGLPAIPSIEAAKSWVGDDVNLRVMEIGLRSLLQSRLSRSRASRPYRATESEAPRDEELERDPRGKRKHRACDFCGCEAQFWPAQLGYESPYHEARVISAWIGEHRSMQRTVREKTAVN